MLGHSPHVNWKERDMTDSETGNPETLTAGPAGQDQQQGIQLGMMAQYTKDFSFENPNAPQSFSQQGQQQPKIDVSVNVNARRGNDEAFEVELRIGASAELNDSKLFIVELVYAGLFAVRNAPQEALEPILLIECPRLLFPFARRIVADAVRDGGFPPLLLDPIDFVSLYQQHKQQAGAEGSGVTPSPNGSVGTTGGASEGGPVGNA